MPTTPSVTNELLTGIANFVSGDVASVLINGTVSITNLTKTVANNTLTVLYTVLPSQATEVTSIALLDSQGNVLTETTVYVPVGDETQFQHIIPIAEGVVNNG